MLKHLVFYFKRNVSEGRFSTIVLICSLIVGENQQWKETSRDEKIDFIIYLLEQCELVDRSRRCQAMRAILYLIQGNFTRPIFVKVSIHLGVFYQCSNMDEYMTNAKENVLLLYTCDGVHVFVDLFNMEMNQ